MNLIEALLVREFPNREARRRATPEEIARVAWRDGYVTGAERQFRTHLAQRRKVRCASRTARQPHYEGFDLP